MKTVTQIANELGVSRQAIHKKIKQEPLSSRLKGFTTTVGNGLQFTKDGETLIKSAFKENMLSNTSTKHVNRKKPVNSSDVKKTSSNISTDKVVDFADDTLTHFIVSLQDQITTLTEQNKDLREQLNEERQHSRKQLVDMQNKLISLTEQAQSLASNAQHLHAIESKKDIDSPQVLELDKPRKRSFLGLFSRGGDK